MNKYEDLKIWQKAMLLVEKVYLLAGKLPENEKYGLTSQIKRASISIPSNIAEGAGRNHKKEFKNFLSISNGSTLEVETQLLLMVRLGFVSDESIKELMDICKEIKNMNFALQKSLDN